MASADVSMILLNTVLYGVSALATLINAFVFLRLGVKRYPLFIALFLTIAVNNFCFIIYNCALLNGAAQLDWLFYFNRFSYIWPSALNMILAHLCFNIWACLYLGNAYLKNSFVIHCIYIFFSLAVSVIENVIYLISNINLPFDLFYVVIVGGLSLILVVIKLTKDRINCLNILKRSNISSPLLYRLIIGATILIIIGTVNIIVTFQYMGSGYYDLNQDITYEQLISINNVFDPSSLIGLATSVLLGTSVEPLQWWRSWAKTYVGIDLSFNSTNTKMSIIPLNKSVAANA